MVRMKTSIVTKIRGTDEKHDGLQTSVVVVLV